MAKDFLGNELNVGDEVAYFSPHYRTFQRGNITKISPKVLYIEKYKTKDYTQTFRQFHEQVIKIETKFKPLYVTLDWVYDNILNLNKDSLDK